MDLLQSDNAYPGGTGQWKDGELVWAKRVVLWSIEGTQMLGVETEGGFLESYLCFGGRGGQVENDDVEK